MTGLILALLLLGVATFIYPTAVCLSLDCGKLTTSLLDEVIEGFGLSFVILFFVFPLILFSILVGWFYGKFKNRSIHNS